MERAAVLKALNRDRPENSVRIAWGRWAMARKMRQREGEEGQRPGDRCVRGPATGAVLARGTDVERRLAVQNRLGQCHDSSAENEKHNEEAKVKVVS